eukprot:8617-Heterococcus_DN1.PRE.2
MQTPCATNFATAGSPSASLSSSKSQTHLSAQILAAHEQQQRTAASQSSQTLTKGPPPNERQSGHHLWQHRSASSSSEQEDGQHSGSALTDRSFFIHDAETMEDLPAQHCHLVADVQGIFATAAEQYTSAAFTAYYRSSSSSSSTAAEVPLIAQQHQHAKLHQYETLQLQLQQCFAALANVPAVPTASPALVTAARFFIALSSSGALRCSSTSCTCDECSPAQQQQQQQCQHQQCSRSHGVRLYEVGEAFGKNATHSAAVMNAVVSSDSPSYRCIMAAALPVRLSTNPRAVEYSMRADDYYSGFVAALSRLSERTGIDAACYSEQ